MLPPRVDNDRRDEGCAFRPGIPNYNPKHENTKRSLSLGIPNFSKMQKRKQNPYSNVPDYYDDENIAKGFE